ncbi:MAG: hypothetical protein J6L65_02885 [Lachnospiraceae bacterium]|nr:hypothetical protein [Lachnospiraceae bacterium]
MRKWQRSMRRILAVIVAVALLGGNMEWTTLKVSATEENPPVVTEGEEITIEVSPEIEYMELPTLETSAVSISMFALRGNENVPLADGTHAKWIERLDLTGADYAMPFYNWLVENSDNDGAEDALIDPTATSGTVVNSDGTYYYTLKEFTGKVAFTFEPNASVDQIKSAGSAAVSQVLNTQENLNEVSKYATAVYSAFDRDYPQVFWLSGASTVISSAGNSYTYTAENGTGTANYTQTVGFLLKKESAEDAFDIRATGYQQPETIRTTIQSLDSKVTQIMNGAESTTYDKVKYFNEWLTKNNCYNSNLATAGHDVRECISALSGRTDTDGPVCEGYARAFKVLCDKAGIPCVLVSGNADNGSGTPEAHMWNYVQIDGKWYAVDVTWNDPSVQGVTGAVSNHEREDYLLVGSNTSIGEKEFATSHVMTNTVTENGVAFTNEPAIEETAYVPTVAYTAPTAKEGLVYNGTEQELVIAGETTGGTMQYSLEKNGTYSTTIPVALNAGSYDVWYKVVGEGNYADTEPVSIQVSVAKATPTAEMFVFDPPADLTYTAQKKSAEITTNKEGMGEITVKYYKDDVEIEPINAGTYTVKIAVAEGRNYTAVTNLPINTFTINKAQATITVATTPIEVNLGDAAFNLNATENNTDDEAALTYASSNDAVVRVSSDGTVTVEGVGTATITVSLGASTNYIAATSKEINITVNRVILSEMEINKNYFCSRVKADRIDLAAMLTEDCGTVEYVSVKEEGHLFFTSESARPNVDSEGILTYTLEAGNVGETGIITVEAKTQNYGTITIKVNITFIDQMPVSIQGDGEVEVYNNTLTYGEKVSVLTFKPVEFVDEDGNVVEGTLAWQEPDAVPTVETSEVDWVFTPEEDAFALLEGTVSIVVNKANSVVTAAPTPKSGLTYNGDVQQLINEGTATGGEMQYSLDATTWNTTIPTAKDVGTYIVYYKVAGDANHNDIEQKTIEVTIAQKDITGAAVDFNESFIYDGTAHEPVSIAVVLDGNTLTEDDYTISGYANNINAGTASITIAGKGNYTGTVTKNFTISKATAPVVVTPTAASITYGQSLAHATLSDNAWSWVDETIIPVSINNFEAYIQVDDSNYDYTGVQGYDRDNHRIVRNVQVIVNKTDITITAKSYSIKVGDTLPAFEYEVTGLPIGEVLPVAVSVFCTATNSSTAGTYDITVSGPASTDLYVITYVPGTLEITKKAQSITAGDVTLTYGDADKKITASTDGDGALTYTVAEGSRDVVSVASDGTITALKSGEATVRITAAETAGYKAAEKTIKVTVDKATLTIVSVEAVDKKYDGTKNVEITSVTLRGILGSDVVTVKFPAGGTLTGTLNSADVGTYTEVQIQVLELAGTDAANYTLEPAQYLATDVTISKADAYTVPVITKEYTYDKGSEGAVTLDIAALLKSDRGNTTYELEQEEVPFLSECTIEENGVLKYTVDNTGNIGDMATIMIKATSQNYEDVSVQVKLSLKDKEPEVTPTPAPTATPTPTPTVAPTQAPTATPAPTVAPTQAPTATPAPTAAPAQAPATTTAPSVSGQPYLVHENGTMGWEAIRSDIAETAEGNTIIVNMNGATSVPAEVLADIKGKDITMTYQLSNGVSWTVNGNRITEKNPKALDFGVVTSTEKQFVNRIPIEVLNKVTSGRNHVDISLAYDGDLGMSAILNVNLGSQNKGYFANLFYYDENRKVMQFIGADDIDANGMAHLVFTHASEYSIVIDKEIMSATSGTMSPATGDSQPVAMAVLFMILASMGIGITLITGRKEDEL